MSYKSYTAEFTEKSLSLALSSDTPISQTAKELGLKESTLYSWVNQTGACPKACGQSQEPSTIKEIKKLKENSLRSKRSVTFKKGNGIFGQRKSVKYAWISKNTSHFSLVSMCQVTGVCKSGFYRGQNKPESLMEKTIRS